MPNNTWYPDLIKPPWAPPAWLFGPVWTILYILIFISFGSVFIKAINKELPLIIFLPFILNLVFNFAFPPLQFGLQNNFLASIDIICILASLVWAMIAIYPYAAWITWIQIPYLLWVTFATVLQLTITFLNWHK